MAHLSLPILYYFPKRPVWSIKLRMSVLTPRQQQMVQLLTHGLTNREIAAKMKIKEDSVKHELVKAYDAAGMSNRVEMALWWRKHGFNG